MERHTIHVDSIETKSTSAGKPYIRIKCGDLWYTSFVPEVITNLKQDDQKDVMVEISQKGRFTNRNIMEVLADAEPLPQDKTKIPSSGGWRGQMDPIREAAIEWQGCLHGAAIFCQGQLGAGTEVKADHLIALTDRLYAELQKRKATASNA